MAEREERKAIEQWYEELRMWYYRGSLKFCNYSCSYCPFSKKAGSSSILNTDRENFFRFIERLEQLENLRGAVQIVPYGEALIHQYYWEGLARLSRHPGIEAVGAQSNFSFPVDRMLQHFINQGGNVEKLRLWGTFHPEMTTREAFVNQCEMLSKWKVAYCVGAVGVPTQIAEIQRLREQLPSNVYLWINKMDGLGRNYTEEEIQQILAIDEYFDLELRHHMADASTCGNQIFVEADGTLRRCNICKSGSWNLYDANHTLPQPLPCTRKECSCYLAYNNRQEPELLFFQPYPAFRIPKYPRAVFLDIDGTLIPEGEKQLSSEQLRKLRALAKHSSIYLATARPMQDALRKVQGLQDILAGGVFASGGRCVSSLGDEIYPMETDWLDQAELQQKAYGFRIHTYQKDGQIYKITLTLPAQRFSNQAELELFAKELMENLHIPQECRWFVENHCIQVVRRDRGKLEGILEIMRRMGCEKEEIMVAGNAEEDRAMLEYFPWSVKV